LDFFLFIVAAKGPLRAQGEIYTDSGIICGRNPTVSNCTPAELKPDTRCETIIDVQRTSSGQMAAAEFPHASAQLMMPEKESGGLILHRPTQGQYE
jgi:hypothetical protein